MFPVQTPTDSSITLLSLPFKYIYYIKKSKNSKATGRKKNQTQLKKLAAFRHLSKNVSNHLLIYGRIISFSNNREI